MSRYFELMQASERDQAAQARRRGEPVPPMPAEHPFDTSFPLTGNWTGTSHSLATVPGPRLRHPQSRQVFSLRFLAAACFRRPRIFLGIAGATVLITILVILLMPRRYQATMQLLASNIAESDVNAQAELLRSRDVLSQALDRMGTLAMTAFARDQAIDDLERNLQVGPIPGSNLLQVSYTGSSPEKAKDVLQAITSSFVSSELALLRPTRQQLTQELVDRRRSELTLARQIVASFNETNGIASAVETNDVKPLTLVQSTEFDRLQESVATAQRKLDFAVQQRDQAVMEDALERDRIRNVAFASRPSASSIPVKPRPLLYFVSGLLSAMFLAFGICAIAELKRSTVYSPAELEALTGLTTLGTVPMQRLEVRK